MTTLSTTAVCGTCHGPGRVADPWFGGTMPCPGCHGTGRVQSLVRRAADPAAVRDALETLLRALHATPVGWQEDGDVVQAVDAAAELCGREPGRYELATLLRKGEQ